LPNPRIREQSLKGDEFVLEEDEHELEIETIANNLPEYG